jgi:hypothetical protein
MDMYLHQPKTHTRWASYENPSAGKGQASTRNRGHKGSAFAPIPAGQTATLVDSDGPGIIRRIWITVADRSPQMLRSLRLECFWDHAAKPAVSAPLSDFFSVAMGRLATFESELFASPEGRSFCCFIAMPFRSHARITVTNDSAKDLSHLFYDVNFTLEPLPAEAMYFHAHFRRQSPTTLGQDFEILPRVTGRGRFLGSNVGLMADPLCDGTWWGEGEVKAFLDGDRQHPTLAGSGLEDYISTGWGLSKFSQRYHGCLVDDPANRQWSFYRLHMIDPIYFHADCRVTLEQVGGAPKAKVAEAQARGAKLMPISTDVNGKFTQLLELSPVPTLAELGDECWVNFLRQDDLCATAYFYLDRPTNDLPPIPSVELRTAGLVASNDSKRADA